MLLLALERMKRDLSQRRLARRAGIAYKTLQLLESGRGNPRWSTLVKLARVLGVPAQDLGRAGGSRRADIGAEASVSEISIQILREGSSSWTKWLFEFVDAFRKNPCSGLASRAPDPGLSPPLLALLASAVEFLCAEQGVPVPWWCAGIDPLRDPWFVSGVENLKASALVESPTQFRRRNIFVLGNFLARA
ncbi:MAG: helix-turn-helix transcriptional regulator [Elusimicrobia bacterium]|nr:helix-turn-helix transcriptional regulator [Elusimicrobiota bacterium]